MNNNKQSNGLRTSSNSLPRADSARRVDLTGNLSSVAYDVTRLAELQGQLFVVDVQEAQQKLKPLILLAAIGGLLALCAMPLLLVAITHGLMAAGMKDWAAYLLVSGAGLLVGGGALWLSWRSAKDAVLVFERSRAEMTQNFQWLKQILHRRCETAGRTADSSPYA